MPPITQGNVGAFDKAEASGWTDEAARDDSAKKPKSPGWPNLGAPDDERVQPHEKKD